MKRTLVAPAAAVLLAAGVACNSTSTPAGGPPASTALPPAAGPAAAPAPVVDTATNDVGRVLAGLAPRDAAKWQTLTATAAWKRHEQGFGASWGAFGARAKSMATWRDAELGPYARPGCTLFYPFSGPDILNANILFPGCDTYVMFSLEPVGALPRLDVPEKQLAEVFEDVEAALADIFKRNYFITNRMAKELRTPHLKGNLGLMLLFLARTGNDVVGVRDVQLGEDARIAARAAAASPAPEGPRPIPGVEVRFTPGGGRVQTLYYFPLDVANPSLAKVPQFARFVRAQPHVVSFTKAASYLMHDRTFSDLRSLTLEVSELVVDDDSGVPYRFFDQATWSVQLYGAYTRPIRDFANGIQEDLDKAYAKGPVKPLPFHFGYHWGDQYSNILVAARKSVFPNAGAPTAPGTAASGAQPPSAAAPAAR